MITREKAKAQMMIELRASSVDTTCRKSQKYLIELYTQHNINHNTMTQDVGPGWCGKPTGILQNLFERGFIDSKLVVALIFTMRKQISNSCVKKYQLLMADLIYYIH